MFDDACAERVAKLIAERYCRADAPMAAEWDRKAAAITETEEKYAIALEAYRATRTPEDVKEYEDIFRKAIEESRQALGPRPEPVAFDAMALIEERCGRFVRGAHVGKLRGWANIEVCTEGGWQKLGPGQGNGRVLRPGQIVGLSITDFNGKAYLEVR
jgi:hypothetical protein